MSRSSSPYNQFMQVEIAQMKRQFPELDHRKAFKLSAVRWAMLKNTISRLQSENASMTYLEVHERAHAIVPESNILPEQNGIYA